MPCSPGSRVPSGLPRLAKFADTAPVDANAASARAWPVATTTRTTRFCRTHVHLSPQGLSAVCTRAARMLARRTISAARRHEASGSRRAIRPALNLSRPTLPRPPQAQLAKNDDTSSPLKVKPGWATHTTNPNFGKVEYFHARCLTAPQLFCPTGDGNAVV